MEIILADFDWITLLFLLLAAGSGLLKGLGKKRGEAEVTDEEEETWEEPPRPEPAVSSSPAAGDPVQAGDLPAEGQVAAMSGKDGEVPATREDEGYILDIRQAVISSEILRRPDF